MKAMLFAAGLGTRLRPLTDHLPKALVELKGTALLIHQLNLLKQADIKEVIINIHHHAEKMVSFIENLQTPGMKLIISDESQELLDTGGGLKQAAQWLNGKDPFFVINADVICNFDLRQMLALHLKSRAEVSLAVTNRHSSRQLLFDSQNKLCGWKNNQTGELKSIKPLRAGTPFSFSGIHLINPIIFELFDDEKVFSIIDAYLKLGDKLSIQAFEHPTEGWFDVGDIKKLEAANLYYQDRLFSWESN
jgi:NDP-sugar pyrophosphorylase family protein